MNMLVIIGWFLSLFAQAAARPGGGALRFVQLSSGERMAYAEYGIESSTMNAGTRTVLYFHGLLGSRLEAAIHGDLARERNIRLIAIDRPGYGQTEVLPPDRHEDFAELIREFADRLAVGRFAVVGVSTGAMHAAAVARYLGPARVAALALLSGIAPVEGGAYPFCPNTLAELAFLGWSASGLDVGCHHLPRSVVKSIWSRWTLGAKLTPHVVLPFFLRAEPDRACLEDEGYLCWFLGEMAEGADSGPCGFIADLDFMRRRHWGFALGDIAVQSFVFQGTDDELLALSAAETLHGEIAGSQLFVMPGEAHISLVVHQMKAAVEQLSRASW